MSELAKSLCMAAFVSVFAAAPAAANIVSINRAWGAQSQLWDGRHLAICIEPGLPGPWGRQHYRFDPAPPAIPEDHLRALAYASALPKEDREALALAAVHGLPLPDWALLADRPVRAAILRSARAQDILVISIPAPRGEVTERYLALQEAGWVARWAAWSGWGRTYNGHYREARQSAARASHTVPEPGTVWLVLAGAALLAGRRFRKATTGPEKI